MEEEEKDNIYIYTDEEDENKDPKDNSGPNFAQVDQEALIDRRENGEENKHIPCPNLLMLMLKVLLNPVEGWKSVRRNKVTPEQMQRGCFVPMVTFLALSCFAEYFYSARVTLALAVEDAVIDFVSFFFGYFIIILMLRTVMPKVTTISLDSSFGKVFVLMSLSTLCLFYSLTMLFPMLWAILIFLPLWTVYIICKATRFFVFPENRQITCTGILCLIVIGVPMVIDWMLGKLLPHLS